MHGRGRKALAVLDLEALGDLGQRDVHRLLDHGEDRRTEGLDPVGALVAALRARRH